MQSLDNHEPIEITGDTDIRSLQPAQFYSFQGDVYIRFHDVCYAYSSKIVTSFRSTTFGKEWEGYGGSFGASTFMTRTKGYLVLYPSMNLKSYLKLMNEAL